MTTPSSITSEPLTTRYISSNMSTSTTNFTPYSSRIHTSFPYSSRMQAEIEPHQQTIQQFRDSLSTYFQQHDTERIVIEAVNEARSAWRWLKACDYKVKNAVKKFIEAAEYRQLHNLDTILERAATANTFDAAVIRRMSQDSWHGYDHDGCPIFVERFGLLDPLLPSTATVQQRIEYHHLVSEFTQQELLPRASIRAGHLIDRVTSIFDMTSFSLASISAYNRSFVSSVIDINSKIYPEMMNRTIIVHVPYAFSFGWALVKNLIDSNTRSKITIVSALQGEQWEKYASVDSIPAFLGGSHQCHPSSHDQVHGCMSSSAEIELFEAIVKSKSAPKLVKTPSLTIVTQSSSSSTSQFSITRISSAATPSSLSTDGRRHSDSSSFEEQFTHLIVA